MLKHKHIYILLLPLIAMVASGCLFDPKKTDPPDTTQGQYQPQTSPQAVMENLRVAYERREFDEYSKLFDHDEFIFKFSEADVSGTDPLPPSWPWDEEELSTRALFENNRVTSIDLEFTYSDPEVPDPNQIDMPPPDTQLIVLQTLTLAVTQDNEAGGEQDIFLVQNDRHEFFLREYTKAEDLIDGEPVWKIVEWRDKALGDGNRIPVAEALP